MVPEQFNCAWEYGLDSCSLVADNEPSGSTNGRVCLDQPSDCQLLKKEQGAVSTVTHLAITG
jgi:hypothetical protein